MNQAIQHSANLLRHRGPGQGRVTYVELFFDLVFVFAVTQLSHHLLAHLSLQGAGETLLLLMAVWFVWIDTSWVTNWLDPERAPVRLLLIVLMLAGLFLSTAIPGAFTTSGLGFAIAYSFMQVGRSLFMVAALRGHSPGNHRNFVRISTWLAVAAAVWIAGGLLEGPARLAGWIAATAIEYAGPAAGFAVPGLGRSSAKDWDVEGGHIAERCALFVIIALGESIVVTGTSFAGAMGQDDVVPAFLVSFVGSAAMWWIYFDKGAQRGSERISSAEDPGALARFAYTYLHLPIVAGIIVAAVGDDLVLAHSHAAAGAAVRNVLIGGPALYVAGNLLFKHVIFGRPPLSHMVGLLLFLTLDLVSGGWSVLETAIAATLALLVVAAWEMMALRRS